MNNVIYVHTEKRPEGKDTLVKDLGKKSQFSHTLKLAQLYHWQLARLAHWQLAPMPNWRGLLTDNNRQRLKMKKKNSPNQDQTHHFKQNPKQTQKQSTDQKKLLNKGNPTTYRKWRDCLAIICARKGMARVMNWQLAPIGATVRAKLAPIKPTMERWKFGKAEVRSDTLGLNQKPNTKELTQKTNQARRIKK